MLREEADGVCARVAVREVIIFSMWVITEMFSGAGGDGGGDSKGRVKDEVLLWSEGKSQSGSWSMSSIPSSPPS